MRTPAMRKHGTDRQLGASIAPRRNTRPVSSDSPVDFAQMAEHIAQQRNEARHAEIARRAYFRAEQRGFAPGHEIEDWLEAERQIGAADCDGSA
jgi:hypothetical protein